MYPRLKKTAPACRPRPMLAMLACSLALAACGGGGGGSSGSSSSSGGASGVTLSGTVATGAAVTNATVRYACTSGSGSIAANATTGAYSASGLTVTLPCVLEATGNSGTTTVTLHSVAEGSGGSVTANVTPLTELLVAQLTGTDPAAYYSSVNSGSISTSALTATVTSTAVSSSAQAVVNLLASAGVDTSSITNAADIVSASFTAANGSTTGSGQDVALDALATTLTTTNSNLGTLTTAVVASTTSDTSTTTTSGDATATGDTSMIPAATLALTTSASNCKWLRSGKYQFVGSVPGFTSGLVAGGGAIGTLDVATMTFAWDDGTGSGALVPVSGQNCRYTITENSHTAELVVAPSGVMVARTQLIENNGNNRLGIALPIQTITVSDLAGDWNGLVWDTDGTSFVHTSGRITITSAGNLTIPCAGDAALSSSSCTSIPDAASIAVNGGGGYTLNWSDGASTWTSRAFAYKAGNGQTVIVEINSDGGISIFTKVRTLTLPSVGDSHKAWNIQEDASGLATDTLAYNQFDITSTDSGAGSFARTVTNLGTSVSHSQTLAINSARDGWMHRAAGSATGSDGNPVTIRAMYGLKLGIGITAYYLPANNGQTGTTANSRFGLSVTQP